MKTNQEIFDFFGVEIGKKYKITKQSPAVRFNRVGYIFVVKPLKIAKSNTYDSYLQFEGDSIVPLELDITDLRWFEYEEVKPEILNAKEKEYLQVVIKPFRSRVKFVYKQAAGGSNRESIKIRLNNDDYCLLPFFKPNQTYEGMERYKEYTLEELGL